MIYLDNAATTPLCPGAIELIKKISEELFYNPSALYGEALKVKNLVDNSRKELSEILGVESGELYFTSCATESNNWAYEKGVKNKKGNIVISSAEHASGYESALIQKNKGIEVRFVKLNKDGTVNEDDFIGKIDKNTSFVSVIHVSNETGAMNDIGRIFKKVKSISSKIITHSDGVQAFCKNVYSLKELDVDMYSISAHKVGGLKGVGALYIKRGINISPFISGGGQERGLRSGTENVAGILTFAMAAKRYKEIYRAEAIQKMNNFIINSLSALDVSVNGYNGGPILSLTIPGIKAEILQHMLSDKGVLIGLGSACSSRSRNNRVLSAMGLSAKQIEGSIRISLGPLNNFEQIKTAAEIIKKDINTLRGNING